MERLNSDVKDTGAAQKTAWDSLGEDGSSKGRKMAIWETLKAQANRELLPDGLVRWLEGVDPVSLRPKPFDVDLRDFLDEGELRAATAGKTMAEHREIVARNQEAIVHNNEELNAFSEHVIQISEMSSEELEAFCHDERTSDSDKSIASCIGVIRDYYESHIDFGNTGLKMMDGVRKATESIYGFGVVEAQEILKKRGSHFKILTSKEREAAVPGSLEDIASAALESFAANPSYENKRIKEYDEYLYGIQLDCTKRKVVKEKGVNVIREEVDLDEFQARVMESMSDVVFSDDSPNKVFTESEHADMPERVAKMRVDHAAGRHFYTRQEERAKTYLVESSDGTDTHMVALIPGESDVKGRPDYDKRIRRSCKEVFKYSGELAAAETKPLIDKINLDKINEINNDKKLGVKKKFEMIARIIQDAFGVQNLDKNGQSRPIEVRWFRYNIKLIDLARKAFNIPKSSKEGLDEAPSLSYGAYYNDLTRGVYLHRSRLLADRLSMGDLNMLAHEMWHARQYDLMRASSNVLKARMYKKNNLAYAFHGGYRNQLMEQEAFAAGKEFQSRLKRYRLKKIGKTVAGLL